MEKINLEFFIVLIIIFLISLFMVRIGLGGFAPMATAGFVMIYKHIKSMKI